LDGYRTGKLTAAETDWLNVQLTPYNLLTESTTNPRRIFEDAPLRELADSIRTQGVLSPSLV
jgi:ParB family chromosome partitioning protein